MSTKRKLRLSTQCLVIAVNIAFTSFLALPSTAQTKPNCQAPSLTSSSNPTVDDEKRKLRSEIAFVRCRIAEIRLQHSAALENASLFLYNKIAADSAITADRQTTLNSLITQFKSQLDSIFSVIDSIGSAMASDNSYDNLAHTYTSLLSSLEIFVTSVSVSPVFHDYEIQAAFGSPELSAAISTVFLRFSDLQLDQQSIIDREEAAHSLGSGLSELISYPDYGYDEYIGNLLAPGDQYCIQTKGYIDPVIFENRLERCVASERERGLGTGKIHIPGVTAVGKCADRIKGVMCKSYTEAQKADVTHATTIRFLCIGVHVPSITGSMDTFFHDNFNRTIPCIEKYLFLANNCSAYNTPSTCEALLQINPKKLRDDLRTAIRRIVSSSAPDDVEWILQEFDVDMTQALYMVVAYAE